MYDNCINAQTQQLKLQQHVHSDGMRVEVSLKFLLGNGLVAKYSPKLATVTVNPAREATCKVTDAEGQSADLPVELPPGYWINVECTRSQDSIAHTSVTFGTNVGGLFILDFAKNEKALAEKGQWMFPGPRQSCDTACKVAGLVCSEGAAKIRRAEVNSCDAVNLLFGTIENDGSEEALCSHCFAAGVPKNNVGIMPGSMNPYDGPPCYYLDNLGDHTLPFPHFYRAAADTDGCCFSADPDREFEMIGCADTVDDIPSYITSFSPLCMCVPAV